jgi:hypothetical protein
MRWVTCSHLIKYFCDIYSEYITPCTVMIYVTSNAIRVTPPWLHTLRSGATVWTVRVDNTTNSSKPANLFILFREMNKFLYHILPIIHAYNAGTSRLDRTSRLRSYIPTPVIHPDSDRTIQLCSHISTLVVHHDSGVPCILPPCLMDDFA